MAVPRLAPVDIQPKSFAFTPANAKWAKGQIAKYPEGRQASAVIPLLWRAQEQAGGWVPQKAIEHVADMLDMPYIRVLEVATFYTMFNLEPVGRYHVQLCGTTPCVLRGAEDLKKVCHKRIGEQFHVTKDGKFSWVEVECLGACVNAPMVQINYDFYEDLTADSFEDILDQLQAGMEAKPGPQVDRQFSAPIGGPTTLTSFGGGDQKTKPRQKGAAVADAEAKRPGKAASNRASPEPKAPLGEGAKGAGVKGEGTK